MVHEAYYARGRRVMIDGVPCLVFAKRQSKETGELKARLALATSGECEWEPHPDFPNFTFTPAERGDRPTAKARPKASAAPADYNKDYYKGGHRVVVDGVPMRVARKPSRNALAMMRENRTFAEGPFDPNAWAQKYEDALEEMRADLMEWREAA